MQPVLSWEPASFTIGQTSVHSAGRQGDILQPAYMWAALVAMAAMAAMAAAVGLGLKRAAAARRWI